MLTTIENGLRGGISTVCGHRYVDVEGKNYITNENIESDNKLQEWLLYLAANNLYGHSMSQKLPTGNFKWLHEKSVKMLDCLIRNKLISADEKIGYILDVELVVPKTKKFANFPLAPEKR